MSILQLRLIIVNGLPATGKTTISRLLAKRLGWPLLAKDDLEEFLFDTLGVGDVEWSMALGRGASEALYDIAGHVLAAGRPLIIENSFNRVFAEPRLAAILQNCGATAVEVYCRADRDVRNRRFERRFLTTRHPGHQDHLRFDPNEPDDLPEKATLGIGQVIMIDTTESEPGYQREIAAIIKQLGMVNH